MAARKKQTAPEPAEGEAPEHVGDDTGPGDIAVDESFADADGPKTPVSHIRVRGEDERPRAAGHVLTERGWEPE